VLENTDALIDGHLPEIAPAKVSRDITKSSKSV
jgi:hypothetical protein